MSDKIVLLGWSGSGKASPLQFDEVPEVLGKYYRSKRRWYKKQINRSKSGIAVNANDRILYLLEETVSYSTNRGTIIVPAGFIWDGASVPNGLQSVEPAFDDETYFAALLHDWLYATEMLPREVADDLFRQAAKIGGAGGFRRFYLFWSVRIGAGSVWTEEHSDESVWWARDLMMKCEWLKRYNPWGDYMAFKDLMLLNRPRPALEG